MNTHRIDSVWTIRHKAVLAALLLIQFAAAYIIGSGHLLTNESQSLIPPIGVTAVIPVVLFLAAYNFSAPFRNFVLAQDIRTLTAVQLWRVVGLAFLLLYAYQVVPAFFAWPAGIGDVAVGLTAFYVLTRIDRDPDYATSSGYVGFQLMGLLDFTVAIATSGLASGAFPALIPAGLTSAAMDVWPLNIFPSFIVPGFIILQLAALLKVRDLRRAKHTQAPANLQTA